MAKEIIYANSPNVALNTPIPGNTTITLSEMTYLPGTSELFVFYNGAAMVTVTELSPTSVIIHFIPDAIGPEIDVFEFHTILQGSSAYIPRPTTLVQVDPPRRPDNFGGKFVFEP